MKNPGQIKRLSIAVAAALSTIAVPGYGDIFTLEEIVVTAQKREQSANDIGMAISAYSGEDLKDIGLADTRDMANLVPGLTMATSASGTPIYTLRGIGFNTPNFSSTSPVGVYIDEVSTPYPFMTKGLTFDTERVEVLKGPQGTLYGRNTTGGLINYISNKPGEELESSVSLNIANFGRYDVEGFISGPVTDTLGARLAVSTHQSNEGWQKSVSRDEDNGEQDRTALRLSLAWQAADNIDVMLTGSWWEDKSDLQAPQAIALTPERPAFAVASQDDIISNPDNTDADWTSAANASTDILSSASEMTMFAARVDWDLENFNVTSLTAYSEVDRADEIDSDGTSLEISNNSFSGDIKAFSQEFRISGKTDQLNWIIGAFFSGDEVKDASIGRVNDTSSIQPLRLGAGVPDGFRFFQTHSEIDSETWSLFAHTEWQMTDTLKLTTGLRYTEDSMDYEGCGGDYNGNTIAVWNVLFGTTIGANECMTYKADFSGPVDIVKDSLDEDNISGRIGLDWAPDDNWLYYASISRGFKSGAFPAISSNVETQLTPATQEEVLAYELGFKAMLLDSSLQINASVYQYDYTDKQVFGEVEDPVFVTLTRLVNVPESEVSGAELDITWLPTENLFSKLSISYLDTEILEYQGFNKQGVFTDFSGDSFEYSPPWQVNAVVGYAWQLNNGYQLRTVADVSYSAESQADFEGSRDFLIDNYTTLGAQASLTSSDQRWSISLWGRNLTDEYYWNSAQVQTDTVYRYAAMPRTYGLTLSYDL